MSSDQRIADELLVLRCQEGDAAAFERLVQRWQERLWRHAWRLTGDADAAWDAVQEGWLAVSRGLPRLNDPAAFPAWAYQIVSHKCRDWLRRRNRQRRSDEVYGQQIEQQRAAARTRDDYADLQEALAQLSGTDRAILSLRYEDQFPTAEIAAILDLPEGTVKSRLYHARQRLRKFLEKSDD